MMLFLAVTVAMLITDVSSVSGQCLEDKYGPDCSYDCHCAEGVTCDSQTGCVGSCRAGWDGPECQRRNVALGRPTSQSSNYTSDPGTSELAVDGITGHSYLSTPCTHTAHTSASQNWTVRLDDVYWIYNFVIYNRLEGHGHRLRGFTLSVGNDSESNRTCYRDTTYGYNKPGSIITNHCTYGPVSGNMVTITSRAGVPLTLCEVLIYVCAPQWYGDMCDKRCLSATECSGCDVTGSRCAECVPGRWGEHCKAICGHCWNRQCNKSNSLCPHINPRCDEGFTGEYCLKACNQGTYGLDCKETCGWCKHGAYSCNTTSGYCSGDPRCMPGYFGLTCKTVCDDRWWGEDCLQECGKCRHGTPCNKASGNCPFTERGIRCADGYKGTQCLTRCDNGTYGLKCSQRCGSCAGGPTVCDTSSGVCPKRPDRPRCMPGYFKEKCDTECNGGTWGEDCLNSCGNCYNGTACNKAHGECPVTKENLRCSVGYVHTNKTCELPCEFGLWGDNCSGQCNESCGGHGCDITNGNCQTACRDGLIDDACQEDSIRGNDQNWARIGGAVGGILGALVLCIVVAIAVILYRRRSLPKDAQSSNSLTVKTTDEIQPEVEGDQSNGGDETEDEENLVNQETPGALHENQGPTSVSVEEFWEHVQNKITTGGFKADFAKFPVGLHAKHEAADLPYNKLKSRYRNLVAYDHSRVVLNLQGPNDKSDYINACYINGYNQPKKFIASQGPTDLIIDDFMRMLWEQDVGKVVMVTNLFESTKQKCKQYWPSEGSIRFDAIGVTLLDEDFYANYTIRTLELNHTKEKNKTRLLKQFHFKAWPDHGVPANATELLDFRDKVLKYGSNLAGPIVVHCSAGIGRTGTFIALDYLINQAKEEGLVDVPACVLTLRQQRVNMVQTQEQYAFLLEALAEALKLGDTSIPSVEFATVYSDLCTVDPESGQSKMAKQFEILQELSQPADKIKVDSARHPDNISKNRYNRFLAADHSRPCLSTPASGCNDYINAVFLPGYKRKQDFIVTQTPLPSTVVDFWRLVYDHGISTVIMLDRVNTGNKSVGAYWTDKDAVFGLFEVRVTGVDKREEFSAWTYELTHKGKKTSKPIKHFRCSIWPNKPTLRTIPLLLTALQSAEMWQGKTEGGPVLVHCRDGVTKSGLFCAAWSVLERLKVDQNVNILQTVKQMRNNRPEIITDVEQLNFIYQVVLGYLDKFQTYANFS